jgi:hypothetical protein
MLILAVDTTSEVGGVAIFEGKECLASVANDGAANIYSITLFQMVDRLVAEARAKAHAQLKALSDIELYAATNGPGSFTGIRVGLAAAQGWAKAFGRPVLGIPGKDGGRRDALRPRGRRAGLETGGRKSFHRRAVEPRGTRDLFGSGARLRRHRLAGKPSCEPCLAQCFGNSASRGRSPCVVCSEPRRTQSSRRP